MSIRGRIRRRWALHLAAAFAFAAPAAAQSGAIQGRVTDAETGQPVVSATVHLVSGTTRAGTAIAGAGGAFRLAAPAGSYVLVASSLGYADQRIERVSLTAGETLTLDVALAPSALELDALAVSVSRRTEKALDAPANVAVVGGARTRERAAVTAAEHVRGLPGVDVAQTGVSQSSVVSRGFNNIFSGSLLVLTDNRYASVPSLRLNAYNMIPLTAFDVDRVEVLLGPASALYGPNSANGVLHVITSSPLDDPGTAVSLAGGGQNLLHAQVRHARALTPTTGIKVSGQYFRARDWESHDPEEILGRDFTNERYGGEVRLDARPREGVEMIATAGLNQLARSLEMTGIGGGQALDWRYGYVQGRVLAGRFFAQAFLNQSDAGDTHMLRTGQAIVDESRMLAGQVQHGARVGERLDLVYGVDLQRTEPRTRGTITGRHEEGDGIRELGGYVHGTLELTRQLSLVGALRADHHSALGEPVWSPRAALLVRPAENQTFRATLNRAFSTPTTNNLFLDIRAATLPIPRPFDYDVRTLGVPATGFTFQDRCEGGLGGRCMRSPLAPGARVAADARAFWNPLVQALVPAALQPLLLDPGSRAGDPALSSMFRRFDQEARGFLPDAAGPEDIARLRPTITNTLEVGYKGILGGRLLVAADLYGTRITDFVGPLRVETPSVFLAPADVAAFVTHRLAPAIAAGAVSEAQARQIIEGLASLPVGTVVPDQLDAPDLVLTFRNFGEVDLWGTDLAFQYLATDRLSLTGSASFVSDDCFDFGGGGDCSTPADVALNAPRLKGSTGVRWSDGVRGLTLEGRVRFTGGFPMSSGVYVGRVDGHREVDLNAAWQLPWVRGAAASITIDNVLGTRSRHFVGAPEVGRLAVGRVTYRF